MTGELKRGEEAQVIWDVHSSPRKVTYLDLEVQSLTLLLNTFAGSYLNTTTAKSTSER